jgi:hypothetical protein
VRDGTGRISVITVISLTSFSKIILASFAKDAPFFFNSPEPPATSIVITLVRNGTAYPRNSVHLEVRALP